jgi:hypothetical protein
MQVDWKIRDKLQEGRESLQAVNTDKQKKKRSFGFKYTNLPLNILIIYVFHSKNSILSKFLPKGGGKICSFISF